MDDATPEEPHVDAAELTAELNRLHEMLEHAGEIDEPLRQELRAVASDIQKALSQGDDLKPLRQRLSETILEFETSHPHITNVVSNVADLLSRFGI